MPTHDDEKALGFCGFSRTLSVFNVWLHLEENSRHAFERSAEVRGRETSSWSPAGYLNMLQSRLKKLDFSGQLSACSFQNDSWEKMEKAHSFVFWNEANPPFSFLEVRDSIVNLCADLKRYQKTITNHFQLVLASHKQQILGELRDKFFQFLSQKVRYRADILSVFGSLGEQHKEIKKVPDGLKQLDYVTDEHFDEIMEVLFRAQHEDSRSQRTFFGDPALTQLRRELFFSEALVQAFLVKQGISFQYDSMAFHFKKLHDKDLPFAIKPAPGIFLTPRRGSVMLFD